MNVVHRIADEPTPRLIVKKRVERMGLDGLSERQRDVLILVGKGLSNKEVGNLLCVSTYGVNDILREVFRKLEVNTRVEAAVIAAKAGLV